MCPFVFGRLLKHSGITTTTSNKKWTRHTTKKSFIFAQKSENRCARRSTQLRCRSASTMPACEKKSFFAGCVVSILGAIAAAPVYWLQRSRLGLWLATGIVHRNTKEIRHTLCWINAERSGVLREKHRRTAPVAHASRRRAMLSV